MKLLFRFALPVVAMGLVILTSNKLVQYPVQGNLWGFDLAGFLTWGAFTYPVAFLVTDTTNRILGVETARKVVYIGFVFGLVLTITVALGIADDNRVPGTTLMKSLFEDESASQMFRIACASGTAFLIAQLLD
ncbi:MAG: queuosine precursor transporter, partial [Pseudomonadota bacterium]|nr:queuosine precursor transporter [Pseudomonadota bacterium]